MNLQFLPTPDMVGLTGLTGAGVVVVVVFSRLSRDKRLSTSVGSQDVQGGMMS